MRRFLLLYALFLCLYSHGQGFPQIEELVLSGQQEAGLEAIEERLSRSFTFEEEITLLRIQGDAHAMSGRIEAASASYRQVAKRVQEGRDNAAYRCLRNTLLTRVAFWEMRLEESSAYADSALFWLEQCKENEIIDLRLFQTWVVAAQAEKLAHSADGHREFGAYFFEIDSLCAKAIAFLESHSLPDYYLSEVLHVHGNSYTDRVHFSTDGTEGMKRYFPLALKLYEREISLLNAAYGPDHPRIGQAWLTTYLAYKYMRLDPHKVDSVAQIAVQSFFPNGRDRAPSDLMNSLMMISVHARYLISNSEVLGVDAVFDKSKELVDLSWFVWKELLNQNERFREWKVNALYNLLPAFIELARETWIFHVQREVDLNRLFLLDQEISYYDALVDSSRIGERKEIGLRDFQNNLEEGQCLLKFLATPFDPVHFLFLSNDTAYLDTLSRNFFNQGVVLNDALMNREPDFHELAVDMGRQLKEAINLEDYQVLLVGHSVQQTLFPLEALLLSLPQEIGAFRSYDYLGNRVSVRYLFHTSLFEVPPVVVRPNIAAYVPNYADSSRELPFSQMFTIAMEERHDGWVNHWNTPMREVLEMNSPMVHLALHGDQRNLRSEETVLQAEDEQLSIDELKALDLKAKFVVLNACRSGQGRVRGVYGTESPARYLWEAGAGGVISNVWPVDDQSSNRMFARYYESLASGMPSHEALARAKRWQASQARTEEEAHPFYWAAAIHEGNSVVVPSRSAHTSWWKWTILLFCVLFAAYLWKHKN